MLYNIIFIYILFRNINILNKVHIYRYIKKSNKILLI